MKKTFMVILDIEAAKASDMPDSGTLATFLDWRCRDSSPFLVTDITVYDQLADLQQPYAENIGSGARREVKP